MNYSEYSQIVATNKSEIVVFFLGVILFLFPESLLEMVGISFEKKCFKWGSSVFVMGVGFFLIAITLGEVWRHIVDRQQYVEMAVMVMILIGVLGFRILWTIFSKRV